ncbi:MAG: hypothetical protein D6761_10660 [Candidatus Dadabacteria bacterium]|nr:MAG: hypothetical protein D6761_10660 [Candidatus Dadabacteria bacterium]
MAQRYAIWLPIILAATVCTTGCSGDVVYIDPVVDQAAATVQYEPQGEPKLELGFYEEQLFDRLEAGDRVAMPEQAQGGVWVMVAIRAKGLELSLNTECTIALPSDVVVGSAKDRMQYSVASDGWIEVQFFPIPIRESYNDPAEPDVHTIADLYGRKADLTCSVAQGDGMGAATTVRVTLARP